MADDVGKLKEIAAKLQIGQYSRHVLLCIGDACCTAEEGAKAWQALKSELKHHNLSQSCFRSKVQCLRVCADGPIAVVYPEGTWYGGLTAETVPEFVEKHLVNNEPIEEMIFARNPVSLQADPQPASGGRKPPDS